MSKAAAITVEAGGAPKKRGKMMLVLIAVPLLLIVAGGGLWFTGTLSKLLGMGGKPPPQFAADQPNGPPAPPVFVDVPEIVANLNAGSRRSAYVKLHARLELARAADQATLAAAMPRLQDMFQTYLREMRPEELRGSAGTWRLREELINRANVAAAPARITDVLFTEMLIQ